MKAGVVSKTLTLLFLALSPLLYLKQSRAQDYTPPPVCERTPKDLRTMAFNSDFRLSFDNDGGILNRGVCWWHARFQRAAWTLSEFRPDQPKPSAEQAARIIDKIATMSGFVEIPGYKNFKTFSADFHRLIQARLEAWQIRDATLGFAWIEGLAGDSSLPADELLKTMDTVFDRVVKQREIVVLKMQVSGMRAHAWLLVDMHETLSGYDLEIIDSNYASKTYIIHYRIGDETIARVYPREVRFIPHIIYEDDQERLDRVVRRDCR